MSISTIAPHRTVLLTTSNTQLREKLNASLTSLRWHVIETRGGAEVLAKLEQHTVEALLLDHWLPDLEITEFVEQVRSLYPDLDLLHLDGEPIAGCTRSPHRNELLYALREALETSRRNPVKPAADIHELNVIPKRESLPHTVEGLQFDGNAPSIHDSHSDPSQRLHALQRSTSATPIEELVGGGAAMDELSKMIHLVAPRTTTVLIEGETGTGKELVARAVHRLSLRGRKPLVVLNCAAIPEALLEAELFGHTRGAFTGATEARTGRMEAAHGGTLFLDEIGEMPLALQAKMLRFLDSGEIQKIGQNHNTLVDVRIIAATHQCLEKRAQEGTFRLDLYHRLAVFPLEVPPLRDRLEDMESLCDHFLTAMAKVSPRKVLSRGALNKLYMHGWPGNVRELLHVLDRASILAGDSNEIGAEHIRLRLSRRIVEKTQGESPNLSTLSTSVSLYSSKPNLPLA